LFKKLQVARDVLTDPIKREEYDRWRRSGMAVSYNKWKELGESTRAVSLLYILYSIFAC